MKRKRLIFVALGAGALGFGLARRSKAAKERSMNMTAAGSAGEGSFGVVEVETEDVDADGNLVVDDLVVAVGSDGKILATDETIAVITPEGDTVIDEKLSVVGDDGELHAVEETSLLRKTKSRAQVVSRLAVDLRGTGRLSGASAGLDAPIPPGWSRRRLIDDPRKMVLGRTAQERQRRQTQEGPSPLARGGTTTRSRALRLLPNHRGACCRQEAWRRRGPLLRRGPVSPGCFVATANEKVHNCAPERRTGPHGKQPVPSLVTLGGDCDPDRDLRCPQGAGSDKTELGLADEPDAAGQLEAVVGHGEGGSEHGPRSPECRVAPVRFHEHHLTRISMDVVKRVPRSGRCGLLLNRHSL